MTRLASMLLPGIAACAVGGCGHLGAGHKGMQPVGPNLDEQGEITRYPDGSAQRTVLEWFRALQRNDAARALAFYAPDTRMSANVIRFERAAGARFFAQAQLPRVISVRSGRARATVFTLVDFRWTAPDGRGYVSTRPQAFPLRLSRGRWQLVDNYFLASAPFLVPRGPCTTC